MAITDSNLRKNLNDALQNLKNKNLFKATNIYEKILKKFPNNFDANFFLGTISAQSNNLNKAIKLFEKAIEINPKVADTYNNLGLANMHLGNLEKSINLFQKATELNPNHDVAICNLGLAYTNLKDPKKAINCYLEAIKINPKNILAHYNLGNLYKRLNDIDNAEKFLNKSIEISNNYLPAYNNLFELYEKSNQNKKLNEILTRAKSIFGDNSIINLFEGLYLYKSKKYEEAIISLEGADFDKVDIMHNQSKIETLAKSYDQIKNYKKAYEYFKELNKIALNTNVNNANKKLFLDLVEKRINFFNKDNTKNWNEINEEDKNADPVFLIGFPRSGTTLLDTILRSHPSVEVLEEIPLINYFIENLESKFGSDLNELGKIDINLIKQMQNFYFEKRDNHFDSRKKRICIDKMPLNIIHVGEIYRFFPNAKFILAIRNPKDSVLSCFMQNFTINHAMANFLNLEDSAFLYDKVMKLWSNYIECFPIKFHTIRYEDLISNFDVSIKNLLTFLKIDWSENMREYYKTAEKRGLINTPSYNQVNQPLYSRSIERWKNYKDKFENINAYLDPWVKYFKY
tara:strand:- start:1592 stop:3307 length:1716 start_codon:yes stop_codon:yes gene_type:complete